MIKHTVALATLVALSGCAHVDHIAGFPSTQENSPYSPLQVGELYCRVLDAWSSTRPGERIAALAVLDDVDVRWVDAPAYNISPSGRWIVELPANGTDPLATGLVQSLVHVLNVEMRADLSLSGENEITSHAMEHQCGQ